MIRRDCLVCLNGGYDPEHVVLVRGKLLIDGMLYYHDDNEHATSEKKYGYRDLLLTTLQEANIPYKCTRRSDTSLLVNDSNHY